jgi:hypothetical protein
VSIISNDGSTLRKTTYLGTPSSDAIYGIQFDKFSFPYVMGTTNGDWTVTNNVRFVNAGAKQFVSKLQPDLSSYIYSTTFGKAAVKMYMFRAGADGCLPGPIPMGFPALSECLLPRMRSRPVRMEGISILL